MATEDYTSSELYLWPTTFQNTFGFPLDSFQPYTLSAYSRRLRSRTDTPVGERFVAWQDIYPVIYHEDLPSNAEDKLNAGLRLIATAWEMSNNFQNQEIPLLPIDLGFEELRWKIIFSPGIFEGALECLFLFQRPKFLSTGIFTQEDEYNHTLADDCIGQWLPVWSLAITPDIYPLEKGNQVIIAATQRTATYNRAVGVASLKSQSTFPQPHHLEHTNQPKNNAVARIQQIFQEFQEYQKRGYSGRLVYPRPAYDLLYLFRVIPTNFLIEHLERTLSASFEEITLLLAIQMLQTKGYQHIVAVDDSHQHWVSHHRQHNHPNKTVGVKYNQLFGRYLDFSPQNQNDPFPFKLSHAGRTLGLAGSGPNEVPSQLLEYLWQNQQILPHDAFPSTQQH